MRIRKEDGEALSQEEIMLVAKVSDALAHPVRVGIFQYIYMQNRLLKQVCNKDVVEQFDVSQATVSQHINKLVSSGLVEVRKVERYSRYYVNVGVLAKYTKAVKFFE